MTNAKIALAPFGKAPKVDNVTLPTIKSVNDDNKLATAIGSIGGGAGGVQRLMCSTAWYLGDMAKAAKLKYGSEGYDGQNFWNGFYGSYYAAKPLTDGAAAQAKANALVYVKLAMLPYDTRSFAETMFDHEHGSMNQKATKLREVIKDHPEKAPTKAEFAAYLPAAPVITKATFVDRADTLLKSLENVNKRRALDDTKALWEMVDSDDELRKAYNVAVSALRELHQLAERVAKGNGKKRPSRASKTKAPEASATIN